MNGSKKSGTSDASSGAPQGLSSATPQNTAPSAAETELRKLSRGWSYDPPSSAQWVERQASRIGVPPGELAKAFADELAGQKGLWETLEVPDLMRITYRYSYGGQSPFFRALRDYGKLLGAKCSECGFTYCPPRKNCSKCYAETRWVELPGTGKIETFTHVYKGTSAANSKPPFICAYIRIDGTDFVMMANVEMEDSSQARVGMPVRVQMKKARSGSIIDFYFVPA